MNSTPGLIILFFLLTFSLINSQNFRIKKVLDANLFELNDGKIVKLAGVDAPTINNPIPFLNKIAKDALYYSVENLQGKNMTLEFISETDSKGYSLVQINKYYWLEKVNYNRNFLMKGFGKFIDNTNDSLKSDLLEAQNYAMLNKSGLWNYYSLSYSDTLDEKLAMSGKTSIVNADPIKFANFHMTSPFYFKIPFSFAVGSAITLGSSLAGYLIHIGLDSNQGSYRGYGGVLLGFGIGYTFGFPLAIYLIEKSDNPNLSLIETYAYSFGTTAAITGLSLILFPNDHNHPTRTLIAFSHIIGALIYTYAFPPLYPNESDINLPLPEKSSLSRLIDYRKATTLFDAELLRIHF